MKILLDENLPKRLKRDFLGHIVFTVRDMGWNGYKNGILLNFLIKEGFNVFITFDKNLQHQQNFEKYSVPVFVLNAENNTYPVVSELNLQIEKLLAQELLPGIYIIKTNQEF